MEAKKLIRLTAPEEVQEFVSAAASCEFDVDLKYNRQRAPSAPPQPVRLWCSAKARTVVSMGCLKSMLSAKQKKTQ